MAHREQEVLKPAGRVAQNTLTALDCSVLLGLTTGADKATTGRQESGNRQKSAAFRDEESGSKGVETSENQALMWRQSKKEGLRAAFMLRRVQMRRWEKPVEVWLVNEQVGLGGKWEILSPQKGGQNRQYVAKHLFIEDNLQNVKLAADVSPQLLSVEL